jgi:carbon storage regulator CsrA
MLVLSRKKNESIVINNDITVTVVEIRGDKVRLQPTAPPAKVDSYRLDGGIPSNHFTGKDL